MNTLDATKTKKVKELDALKTKLEGAASKKFPNLETLGVLIASNPLASYKVLLLDGQRNAIAITQAYQKRAKMIPEVVQGLEAAKKDVVNITADDQLEDIEISVPDFDLFEKMAAQFVKRLTAAGLKVGKKK